MTRVVISRTDEADPEVPLPSYESAGAAGADIRANLPPETRNAGLVLSPFERCLVPAGFRMSLPAGYEAQVRPRSGLALNHGITMPNSPGTVDSDYRGPIGVPIINLNTSDYTIRHGDRIAQMIVAPVCRATFSAGEPLGATERGERGFGSTGKS